MSKSKGNTAAPAKMTPPKSQPHRTKYNLPVVVYFTKEQKQKVAAAAEKHGQNLSAYLRGEALKAAEQAELTA